MPGITIVLEAVSHPQSGNIVIEELLFPIGRSERAFDAVDVEARSRMSRRHARIFVEDKKAYLADLDSSNGTIINGKTLPGGRPSIIHDGDLITFAGELSYRVQLTDLAAETGAQGSLEEKLILQPCNPESPLDTLVINQFPFLVGRKDSVFEGYGVQFPDEIAHLSRRHAIITCSAGTFCIEDLSSKNGTDVNGVTLDEHSKVLSQGDSVSFGTDFFAYTLQLPATESALSSTTGSKTEAPHVQSTASETDHLTETDPEESRDKTVFVDSPTSFLDIFSGEEEDSSDQDEIASDSGGHSGSGQSNAPRSKLHSTGDKARKIGQAFLGEQNVAPRISRPVLAAAVTLIVLLVVVLFYPSDKDRIDKAYERGDYLQSASLANTYLADHPGDSTIEELGTKATLKAALPHWLTYLEKGDFQQAELFLEEHRAEIGNIQDGVEALDLLGWVLAVEQFMAENGGPAGPVDIFQDELAMAGILETWNRSPNRHQQIFSQISLIEPDFKPVQKRTMSWISQLKHSYKLYNEIIETISDTALKAIQADDMQLLYVQLEDAESNYPRLRGLDRVTEDARLYEKRLQQLTDADMGVLVNLQRKLDFETSEFKEYARPRIMSQLPDEMTTEEYSSALDAWKEGNSELAINILRQMNAKTQWSTQINSKISRFEDIESQFALLQASSESKDNVEKLLAFRARLEPDEDIYYLDATSDAFESLEEQLLEGLQEQYTAAKSHWIAYEDEGGISSVMRIEDPVSEQFSQQSARLGKALGAISVVQNTYRSLQSNIPEDVAKNFQRITKEVSRQRSWIQDLSVVLDEDLLQQKLSLLPAMEEEIEP